MSYEPESGRKLLSVNEVQDMAGVSRRTVYNWMNAGLVDFILTPTGIRRIYADTVFRNVPDHIKARKRRKDGPDGDDRPTP